MSYFRIHQTQMVDLTENEALQILPAVVDNEASQDERDAFLDFMSKSVKVQKEYKDALLIKKLLAKKLQRKPAPEHLKKTIYQKLREIDANTSMYSDIDGNKN